ncbi:LysR substrate-binding domain-containing protein [Aminobacter sp. J44]|uniref:LysR substrate-binding domain-containing protein n=1 Tax=Aminobacter sp. J44 TaxID=935262 RepID=UPI0011993617|nr:LysR substrate-binding domain-containing protein [Aminobacter sp. J44]TWG49554.1 aminoethylphosphonate catabolism LysR family transcriptional regulator [Aminobacter sp. J44]
MNYLHLRAFYAVASERSFSRAAQVLNVTQSTLSSQVKALEETYDVRLLDRRGRNVVPTDIGEVLLAQCRELFRQQDEIEDLLNQSQKLKAGRLKIGADGPRHVLPVLKSFMQLHPNIKISLTSGNARKVAHDLLSYETDVAIVAIEDGAHSQLHLEPFARYALVAFVPRDHELARKPVMELSDFVNENLFVREPTSLTRRLLMRSFDRAGVVPRHIIEMDSREASREAVASGLGISVMSELEFPNGDDRTVALAINDPSLRITEYVACLRNRRDTRTIREFFNVARRFRNV